MLKHHGLAGVGEGTPYWASPNRQDYFPRCDYRDRSYRHRTKHPHRSTHINRMHHPSHSIVMTTSIIIDHHYDCLCHYSDHNVNITLHQTSSSIIDQHRSSSSSSSSSWCHFAGWTHAVLPCCSHCTGHQLFNLPVCLSSSSIHHRASATGMSHLPQGCPMCRHRDVPCVAYVPELSWKPAGPPLPLCLRRVVPASGRCDLEAQCGSRMPIY